MKVVALKQELLPSHWVPGRATFSPSLSLSLSDLTQAPLRSYPLLPNAICMQYSNVTSNWEVVAQHKKEAPSTGAVPAHLHIESRDGLEQAASHSNRCLLFA